MTVAGGRQNKEERRVKKKSEVKKKKKKKKEKKQRKTNQKAVSLSKPKTPQTFELLKQRKEVRGKNKTRETNRIKMHARVGEWVSES